MRDLYRTVDALLDQVDFNAIWQGFSRCDFALFNESTVYFRDTTIPWDRRFLGNTAIDYDGTIIATWSVNCPENEDPEQLAASMAHEMFHAYQRQQGETRYPDTFALMTYPDDVENFHVKITENGLLAKAFTERNLPALKEFIGLRKARKRLIGNAILQEYRAETLEGLAEYVGLSALAQISAEKYNRQVSTYISHLLNPGALLFSPRRIAYYTGAILCSTLIMLQIDFYHQLSDERTIFEIIEHIADELGSDLNRIVERKKAKFDDFMRDHTETVCCDASINGYDPMNMTQIDDRILCDRFVILGDEFIPGPVMLVLQDGSRTRVGAYIK